MKNKLIEYKSESVEYITPECEELFVNPQFVLCVSGQPTETMSETDGEW